MERLNSKEYIDSFKNGYDEIVPEDSETEKMTIEEARAALVAMGYLLNEKGEPHWPGPIKKGVGVKMFKLGKGK